MMMKDERSAAICIRINLKKSEVPSLLQQVTGQLLVVLTLTQAMYASWLLCESF